MNILFYSHECQHSLHRIYIHILRPPSTELEQEFKENLENYKITTLMYFGKQPIQLSGVKISYSESSESLNYDKACQELKKYIYGELSNVGLICSQDCIRSCSVLMAFMYSNGYSNNQIKYMISQSNMTEANIEVMFRKIKNYQENINAQLRSGLLVQFEYTQASKIQLTSHIQNDKSQLNNKSEIIIQELNDDSINAQSSFFYPPKFENNQNFGYRQFNAMPISNSQFGPPSSGFNHVNQTKILETDKFAISRPISNIPNYITPTEQPPQSVAIKLISEVDLKNTELPIQSLQQQQQQKYKLPEPLKFKAFKQRDGFKCVNWPKDQM